MDQRTQNSGADDGADFRSVHDRPGVLRGEAWITLQTRQAQRLVVGRKGTESVKPILGLTKFGSIVSVLYVCARLDDPYAQWWLVRIEEALERSHHDLDELRQRVGERLRSAPGFEATIAGSLDPVRVPLKFASPYAYQAARLITAFDALMCAILTARHVGLMDREAVEKTANLGGRAVRRALSASLGYHHEMVRRKDLAEGNARAQKARERMGEVPPDILDRSRQAKHAPEPVSASEAPRDKPFAGLGTLARLRSKSFRD